MEEDTVVATAMVRKRLVHFNDDLEIVQVPYQQDVYGRHPRDFDFDDHGRKRRRIHVSKAEILADAHSVPMSSSPNTRRSILRRVLRDGPAWETPSVERLAKVTKSSKNKLLKARLGAKAAENYEKLEHAADLSDDETSTMFRALAARYLYLAMDRPECAFPRKTYVDSSLPQLVKEAKL